MIWSPSAKRAWIEIPATEHTTGNARVALCEEGVDRNTNSIPLSGICTSVALCEEGVDRNGYSTPSEVMAKVALCEEGVDRNIGMPFSSVRGNSSPSAKRAWIEIA